VVHSFEPLPSAASQYRANLDDAPHVRLHEVAVGRSDGRTSLYEHDYSLASSLRPLTDAPAAARATEQVAVLDVEVTRLDTGLAEVDLPRPCLLKVDVQGTELDVLAGATVTLERVDWIVLELTFSPVYAGEPLFAELDAALEAAGWRLRWPIATLPSAGGEHIVQMDALYDRHDGSPR
jgi:FkbM family methyltransferase